MTDNLGNRKHTRCNGSLNIDVDGKKGITLNVGMGGALALVDRAVPVMEEVAITISTPAKVIRVSGACLRCVPDNDKFKIALFFDDITFSREDKNALVECIESSGASSFFLR